MRGTFIVVEGPDGAGTTTHCALLKERLKQDGYDVVITAEPTTGPIGVQIRGHLQGNDLTPLSLQLLFCADRAWHLDTVIKPALDQGKVVICDRYAVSTIVYAEAQGLDAAMLRQLNRSFLQPDCQIFALPPLSISLARIEKRGHKEIFEHKELQKKIHASYASLAAEDPSIRVVDTSGTKDEAAGLIYALVRGAMVR